MVFVPDGDLGEIVVVEPIAIAGGNYASFLDGRGLMTVEADYTKKCQSFSTELTALCVPNPSTVHVLHIPKCIINR